VTASVAASMLGIMAIGGIAAYLTDADTATNTFTVGRVSLDLVEPHYPGNDSEEVRNLVPNEEVRKDPTVVNDGVNDEYVFLEVYVPYDTALVAGQDGRIEQYTNNPDYSVNVTGYYPAGTVDKSEMLPIVRQLFEYTINNGWIELDAETGRVPAVGETAAAQLIPGVKVVADPGQGIFNDRSGNSSGNVSFEAIYGVDEVTGLQTGIPDSSKGVIRHLYAYAVRDAQGASMTALKSGSSVADSGLHEPNASAPTQTSALFDGVRFANVIEDQGLEQTAQHIIINAYGIQADFVNGTDATIDGSSNNEAGEASDTGKTQPQAVWTIIKNQAPSTSVNYWQDGLSSENATTDAKE